MSSPEPEAPEPEAREPEARSVSPIAAALVPILILAVFVGAAYLVGRAIDGPSWLTNVLVIIGACLGYLVNRTILRWLYAPR